MISQEYFVTLCAILLNVQFLVAQDTTTAGQRITVEHFFHGYNHHDFKEMRSSFHWIQKMVLSEKLLAKLFGTQHDIFGEATITGIRNSSANALRVDFIYAVDPTESDYMAFNFTKIYE